MRSHTPAPWSIDPNVKKEDHYIDISSQEHIGLATAVWRMDGDERTPECEANARLIAASPELLEQVVEVYNSIEFGGRIVSFSDEDIERMGELIAKARGEE